MNRFVMRACYLASRQSLTSFIVIALLVGWAKLYISWLYRWLVSPFNDLDTGSICFEESLRFRDANGTGLYARVFT